MTDPADAEAAWAALWATDQRLRTLLGRALAEAADHTGSVSVTEFMIMRELEDGNAMPMTEVAARVGLSQAGLTRGVARLTRSGRVAVVRDNEDRRVQTLRLLDPGVRALAQARGAVASQLQDVVRPVAAQRLQRLLRALDL